MAHSSWARAWLLPASAGTRHPPPRPQGHGDGLWIQGSTNRLVERGTVRIKMGCDLLQAGHTGMFRLIEHRAPRHWAKQIEIK